MPSPELSDAGFVSPRKRSSSSADAASGMYSSPSPDPEFQAQRGKRSRPSTASRALSEKEQRKEARMIRNRNAAQASRDRKKEQTLRLENRVVQLEEMLLHLTGSVPPSLSFNSHPTVQAAQLPQPALSTQGSHNSLQEENNQLQRQISHERTENAKLLLRIENLELACKNFASEIDGLGTNRSLETDTDSQQNPTFTFPEPNPTGTDALFSASADIDSLANILPVDIDSNQPAFSYSYQESDVSSTPSSPPGSTYSESLSSRSSVSSFPSQPASPKALGFSLTPFYPASPQVPSVPSDLVTFEQVKQEPDEVSFQYLNWELVDPDADVKPHPELLAKVLND